VANDWETLLRGFGLVLSYLLQNLPFWPVAYGLWVRAGHSLIGNGCISLAHNQPMWKWL